MIASFLTQKNGFIFLFLLCKVPWFIKGEGFIIIILHYRVMVKKKDREMYICDFRISVCVCVGFIMY